MNADDLSAQRLAIAGRLREAREYLGLSQEEVASVLKLSRPAVTNIEAGTRKVDALELAHLARLYGRPVSYLLSGEQKGADARVAFAARAVRGLSDNDLTEVARFAEFLRMSGRTKGSRN